jgi:hypothetical protein
MVYRALWLRTYLALLGCTSPVLDAIYIHTPACKSFNLVNNQEHYLGLRILPMPRDVWLAPRQSRWLHLIGNIFHLEAKLRGYQQEYTLRVDADWASVTVVVDSRNPPKLCVCPLATLKLHSSVCYAGIVNTNKTTAQ